jgi:hypothetical protein
MDDEMKRVFLVNIPDEAKLDHVIGTNKWIPSALIGEERVAVEFVMDETSIEASIVVNEGLRNFLGDTDMRIANIYAEDPNGPVASRKLYTFDALLNITVYRVGHSIPPFIAIGIRNEYDIRELFECLFHIPERAELPDEPDSD